MNSSSRSLLFATAALALGACATHAAAPHAASPQAVATLGGPPIRSLELPRAAGAGEPREVRALVDEPALKLATIVLRAGTVLPEHKAAVPVTILALVGGGTLVSGAERHRLDATHAVVLAPNVPHAVEPDAGTDLVLLVHHLGRAAEHHGAEHHE